MMISKKALDGKNIHSENSFDSRIEYTFLSKDMENKDYQCPNCGMKGKIKNFIDGCPYCQTYYNIDYVDKDLGSKYHYDQILRKPTYRMITAIVDFIVCLFLSYLFIKITSRTFNMYDISKIIIYGCILSCVLYYFFYIIDGYLILLPIKKYKEKQNQKQIQFWKRTQIDKTTFFNNLNYEVSKKYYLEENIIDYDILDYLSLEEYQEKNNLFVKVKVDIRIIYFEDNKVKVKYIEDCYVMKKCDNVLLSLKEGVNIIKCPHCGASIDINKGYCEYCQHDIPYLQEWIMV